MTSPRNSATGVVLAMLTMTFLGRVIDQRLGVILNVDWLLDPAH